MVYKDCGSRILLLGIDNKWQMKGFVPFRVPSFRKPLGENPLEYFMAPKGFEPSTPGLKVQCSDQAELRSHILFLFELCSEASLAEAQRSCVIPFWEATEPYFVFV